MKNILNKVAGFSVKAVKAGIKESGALDLGLIVADEMATAAAVFTQSKVVAAPVTLSRKAMKNSKGLIKAMLVNAGNANACTGAEGMKNASSSAKALAKDLGCKQSEILLCSTGIIGVQLPMEKILNGIKKVCSSKGDAGKEFAQAIMTTDLVEKKASVKLGRGMIAGVCKGSGMIAPNMATMLGFILTDIPVTRTVLQKALKDAVDVSFNSVTVDSDTSTNDTVILLSSGKAGGRVINKTSGNAYNDFLAALKEVAVSLAEQIARDGEGATKLVRVNVRNAKSIKDAKLAAKTVAESPLVKTAMFGCDPNWGRIIAALGRSGAAINENKTSISLAGKVIFAGSPQDFNASTLSKKLGKKEVDIDIDLGIGKGEATMLTCDYSYDYIKINAEYHT